MEDNNSNTNQNSNQTKKKYIGNTSHKITSIGLLIKQGFHKSDLEYMLQNLNSRGYFNTVVKEKSDGEWATTPDEYVPKSSR